MLPTKPRATRCPARARLAASTTRTHQRVDHGYTLTIPPTKLIQIDNDPAEIGRNYPVHLGIVGDIRASLEVMTGCAGKLKSVTKTFEDWTAQLRDLPAAWDKYQAPFARATSLRFVRAPDARPVRVIPENAVSDDVAASQLGGALWKARRPRHLLNLGLRFHGIPHLGILGQSSPSREPRRWRSSRRLVPVDAAHSRYAVEYDIPPCGWCGTTTATVRFATCSSGCSQGAGDELPERTRPATLSRTHDARAFVRSRVRPRRARRHLEGVLEAASRPTGPIWSKFPVDREIRRWARAPGPALCRTRSRTSGNWRRSTARRVKELNSALAPSP